MGFKLLLVFAAWLHSGCHSTEHFILMLHPKARRGLCWIERFSSSVQSPSSDIPCLP